MNETVSLKVNQENLVKHLRLSFSNKHTVLGELLQNARRAGASQVRIGYDPNLATLVVMDDGCGISDYQKLLTVAESGWDMETIEREHPFGIGFLSAIYSCETIEVWSKGGHIRTNTADILAFKPVTINPIMALERLETIITLAGFVLPEQEVQRHLEQLAMGFPIPVLFNGTELKRERAIDSGLRFIDTEIGQVYLKGFGDGEDWLALPDNLHVYLQGLPVYHSTRYGNATGNIIHLESASFHARLPDRDKLVDEQDVLKAVQKVLEREARREILERKAALDTNEFVAGYRALAHWKCLDLLNDVPVVPKAVLTQIADYPYRTAGGGDDFATSTTQIVTRESVESGAVKIASLDDYMEGGAARAMFAWHKNLLLLSCSLDKGHWVHAHVRDLDGEDYTIEVVNESHRADFDGEWVSDKAVFCEKYVIHIGGDSIEIDGDSMYDEEIGFIVPKGDASGFVVRQASDYYDEWDKFQEGICESDQWAFQNFVVANTSSDPAQALKRLLPSLRGCPQLFGKSFTLKLDDEGDVEAVALAT